METCRAEGEEDAGVPLPWEQGAEDFPAGLPIPFAHPGLTMSAPRAFSGPVAAPGLPRLPATVDQSPRVLS